MVEYMWQGVCAEAWHGLAHLCIERRAVRRISGRPCTELQSVRYLGQATPSEAWCRPPFADTMAWQCVLPAGAANLCNSLLANEQPFLALTVGADRPSLAHRGKSQAHSQVVPCARLLVLKASVTPNPSVLAAILS